MGRAFLNGQAGMIRYASFADATWTEIDHVAQKGYAKFLYPLGSEKQITLTTGEIITLRIEGFNHDDLESGEKAKITIAMGNLLSEKYRMNETSTNNGGWASSNIRNVVLPMIFSELPSDLARVIKPVIKRSGVGNYSTEIQTTVDILWLFSTKEGGNQVAHADHDEGSAYPLWNSDTMRIKKLANGAGSPSAYWTRTNSRPSYTAFYRVTDDGIHGNASGANSLHGICFGFCI